MTIIKPFRALRPPKALAEKVASLPYDVMDTAEARVMAASNPHSFLRISRAEIDLPPDVDIHSEPVYQKGHENLTAFISQGTLVQDDADCYYVYRQTMGSVTQVGLVVCAGVEDYQSGVIKKHELTRADKEEDRVRHIDVLDANDEPVFYTFRRNVEVSTILEGITAGVPEYDFVTDDGVGHTLWVIRDRGTIDRLTGVVAAIPVLYVADGHHRSAAASRVRDLRRAKNPRHSGQEEYNYFLTVIFPADQLHIMPYNRVVRDLNGQTVAEFMARVAKAFDVTPVAEPSPYPHLRRLIPANEPFLSRKVALWPANTRETGNRFLLSFVFYSLYLPDPCLLSGGGRDECDRVAYCVHSIRKPIKAGAQRSILPRKIWSPISGRRS